MTDPYFFGYGSLVNRGTHDYARAQRAQVTGWRRAWLKPAGFDRCILSAVPQPGAEILGLVAAVPGADWADLDARERLYQRHDASGDVQHGLDHQPSVAIYSAGQGVARPSGEDRVILSYIDVVVQGYLAEFGPAGVAHFFDTTDHWHVRVVNDRAAPMYARARETSEAERAMADHHLARIGVRVTGR